MIIAVDYDGTLEIGGKPNLPLISKLKAAQAGGHIVILWTCRTGRRLNDAVMALNALGFAPNLVNENHVSTIQKMKCNPRKILADIYIDDKNGVI